MLSVRLSVRLWALRPASVKPSTSQESEAPVLDPGGGKLTITYLISGFFQYFFEELC